MSFDNFYQIIYQHTYHPTLSLTFTISHDAYGHVDAHRDGRNGRRSSLSASVITYLSLVPNQSMTTPLVSIRTTMRTVASTLERTSGRRS